MIVAFADRVNDRSRRKSSDVAAATTKKYTGNNNMIVPFHHRRKSDSSVSKASSSNASSSRSIHSASKSNIIKNGIKKKTDNRNIKRQSSSSKSTIIKDPTDIDQIKWVEKKQHTDDKPSKTGRAAVSSSSLSSSLTAVQKESSLPEVHRPRSHHNKVEHVVTRSASWVDRTFASIRRDSVSSIDSKDMIVEFPPSRHRHRKSSSTRSKKADPIGSKSELSRFISKSGRHGTKMIDRSVASCPTTKGRSSNTTSNSKQEQNRRRLHTSERTFCDAVNWRNTSIDWGDDDDDSDESTTNLDESESTTNSSLNSSSNNSDVFVPEKITARTTTKNNIRGRDPAGWSAIDISTRTSDSAATPGLMESGRTMASSLTSILSGSLRKPDP